MGHVPLRAAKKVVEEGLIPPHLQGQYVPELCLHTAKPDAFHQPNPSLVMFLVNTETKLSHVGSRSLVVQQDQVREQCGEQREIRVRKNKPRCHCCSQAGGRTRRTVGAANCKMCWPGDPHQLVHWEKGWRFADNTLPAAESLMSITETWASYSSL